MNTVEELAFLLAQLDLVETPLNQRIINRMHEVISHETAHTFKSVELSNFEHLLD